MSLLLIAIIIIVAVAAYLLWPRLPLGIVTGDVVSCGGLYYAANNKLYINTSSADSIDIIKVFPAEHFDTLKPYMVGNLTADLIVAPNPLSVGDLVICNNMPTSAGGPNKTTAFKLAADGLHETIISDGQLQSTFYKIVKYKVIQGMKVVT